MNRIPSIVSKYNKLHRLGSDILRNNRELKNLYQYDMQWKRDEIHIRQEDRIEEFCKLADLVSEDWAKHHTDINKYWTGRS